MENKLRNTIFIIGEGITETHYIQSLKDDYPCFRKVVIKKLEHANNLAELDARIEDVQNSSSYTTFQTLPNSLLLTMNWKKNCISIVNTRKLHGSLSSIHYTVILRG